MFVKLWMQTDLITVTPDTTLAEAGELMAVKKIRRLPVVDSSNKLLGIISREDIKLAQPSAVSATSTEHSAMLAGQTAVSAYMTADPVTCHPEDPLEKVAATMRHQKIGGIPITKDHELVGIITESDIFSAFTEILGGSSDGMRMEISIDFKQDTIYQVLEQFRDHDMQIDTVAVCNVFSEKSRLLTIHFKGEDIDLLTDSLWGKGFKINSLIGRNQP